jgi:hypothetical protein
MQLVAVVAQAVREEMQEQQLDQTHMEIWLATMVAMLMEMEALLEVLEFPILGHMEFAMAVKAELEHLA